MYEFDQLQANNLNVFSGLNERETCHVTARCKGQNVAGTGRRDCEIYDNPPPPNML